MLAVMRSSTLVGIAGEDDLDAPDLKAPMPPASAAAKPAPNRHGRLNGGQSIPGRGGAKVLSIPAKPILGAEASARLRHQLVGELKAIASSDDAAVWAHRTLGAKNSLTEVDARQVEDAFQAKLETLEGSGDFSDQPLSPVLSAPQSSSLSLARQPVGPAEQPLSMALIRVGLPILSHAAFVTRSTSSSWPNRRV